MMIQSSLVFRRLLVRNSFLKSLEIRKKKKKQKFQIAFVSV